FGSYAVTVTASDGTDADSQYFAWTITSPISLTNPGTQTNAEGDSVSLSLSASYSGSGSLSYAALGLPAGLSLDPSSGAVSGTVAAGAASHGPYNVTVLAEDGTSATTQTFAWAVSGPITISTPADQTSTEGDSISLTLSATGGGTLSLAALNLPAGLVL